MRKLKDLLSKLRANFFELANKVGTHPRYQVAFGLWVGGPALMIGSHILERYQIGSHAIWNFLVEVGMACLIAGIAEFILLEHVSEIFRQEVKEMKDLLERVSGIFRQEVHQDLKILSHCLEHQLVDVMPPRNQEQEKLAVDEINSAIEKAQGEIRIIVFTLHDILNESISLEAPLKRLLNRDADVTVKLLIIDPTSDATLIRFMAEEGSQTLFEESDLCSSLWANFYNIRSMTQIAKRKNKFKIKARFYDILPNFYMVSTPSEVFIEPYHLGHKNGGDSSIGGFVPLFRFSSNSPMYEFAKLHFSYIWGPENGNPPANRVQHANGHIRVRTMEDVHDDMERRRQTLPVENDRRSESRLRSGFQ